MSVPYIFASLPNGTAIPLSYLDADFSYLTTSPSFSGNVSIGGTLDVTGATTLSSTVSVTGSATFLSTMSVRGALTLGIAGTAQGSLKLSGVTSGTVTVQAAAAAGSWSFTLPTTAGTNGYILTTDGTGVSSWTNPTALGIDLDIGSTSITSGTSGRVLYDNAGVLGEYTVTGTAGNVVLSTSPTITTPTISGNITSTGTGARFLADFTNATSSSRFAFQTSTADSSTSVVAMPSGAGTVARWEAANSSDLTNASKISISSNGATDVQLASTINGTGTYLPISIYTNNGQSAQFSTTRGTFTLGVAGSSQGILNLTGATSGVISVKGAAAAGTYNFNLPNSAGTAGQPLLSGGGGANSMTFGTLGVSAGGTGITSFGTGVATWLGTPSSANLAAAVTDDTGSGALVFATSPTLANVLLAAGTNSLAPLTLTSGTNLTTPAAGSIEYDGSNIYSTIAAATGRGYVGSIRRFTLFSAGSAISTIANYFGANSNIPLTSNSVYDIEIVLYYAKGGTGGTIVWTLTNSAAPTAMNVHYEMSPITGVVAPPGTATLLVGETLNSTSAAFTVTTGTITASTNQYARFRIFLQNGAGTSLQIQATSNGSAITPGIGSFWTCTRVPSSNTGTYAA